MRRLWLPILMLLLVTACGKTAARPSASEGPWPKAIAYARCMRAHGIPQWPDPEVRNGDIQIRGVDKSTVDGGVLASAMRACDSLRPVLPGPDMALKLDSARYESRCMREQGVPGYPDPEPDAHVELPQSVRDNPNFERAKAICREKTRAYEPSPAANR